MTSGTCLTHIKTRPDFAAHRRWTSLSSGGNQPRRNAHNTRVCRLGYAIVAATSALPLSEPRAPALRKLCVAANALYPLRLNTTPRTKSNHDPEGLVGAATKPLFLLVSLFAPSIQRRASGMASSVRLGRNKQPQQAVRARLHARGPATGGQLNSPPPPSLCTSSVEDASPSTSLFCATESSSRVRSEPTWASLASMLSTEDSSTCARCAYVHRVGLKRVQGCLGPPRRGLTVMEGVHGREQQRAMPNTTTAVPLFPPQALTRGEPATAPAYRRNTFPPRPAPSPLAEALLL